MAAIRVLVGTKKGAFILTADGNPRELVRCGPAEPRDGSQLGAIAGGYSDSDPTTGLVSVPMLSIAHTAVSPGCM